MQKSIKEKAVRYLVAALLTIGLLGAPIGISPTYASGGGSSSGSSNGG